MFTALKLPVTGDRSGSIRHIAAWSPAIRRGTAAPGPKRGLAGWRMGIARKFVLGSRSPVASRSPKLL
jgi:hypothetical protein